MKTVINASEMKDCNSVFSVPVLMIFSFTLEFGSQSIYCPEWEAVWTCGFFRILFSFTSYTLRQRKTVSLLAVSGGIWPNVLVNSDESRRGTIFGLGGRHCWIRVCSPWYLETEQHPTVLLCKTDLLIEYDTQNMGI